MTLINKNDVNQIFAINAPAQDKPASFANYPNGWDTARSNNGRPTIRQFNFLQQRTDQNILWIHQNGAALPFDSNIEYADGAVVVKDGELQQKQVDGWSSIGGSGIITVDSIADLLAIKNPREGQVVFVKSFHDKLKYTQINLALAKPFKGGGEVTYNSAKANLNDSCMCFYGWERVGITEVDATLAGALADGSGRKLSDLYTESEYNLIYSNFSSATDSIDTVAIKALFKCVYDMRSTPRPAFDGSFTAHIKPVGEYVINAPIMMYASTIKSYDSCITKASGYNGVMFYSTWSYVYDWDGGVFTSRDENTGAIWWLGPSNDSTFNNEASQLRFRNFTATRFKDVFAKFNSQSATGSITGFRITSVQHILGRGLTLNETTGLYTEFLPKDFGLQTNFRTPDWLVIGGDASWISTGEYFDTDLDALFYVGADTTFRNILCVPHDHANGNDVAFCNTMRNAYFDNVRAGGEGGSFALVNYFGDNIQPYPYYQSVITVNNSEIVGLNVATAYAYSLAEPMTDNGALTVKLNRTDGLPDSGVLKCNQYLEYTSINRETNVINLVSPVVSYASVGAHVTNQTPCCVVRLITGAPDQITFSDCYQGAEVGQLVGYSSYSDFSAVVSQFNNCHLDVNTSQIYPLYRSGMGLPPALFNTNRDKYARQFINGITRGQHIAEVSLNNVSSVAITPVANSLYNSLRYKVKLTNDSDGQVSYYTLDLFRVNSTDGDLKMMNYSIVLTPLFESVLKIESASILRFISSSGTQRPAPVWSNNDMNFGATINFTLNQNVTGRIELELA